MKLVKQHHGRRTTAVKRAKIGTAMKQIDQCFSALTGHGGTSLHGARLLDPCIWCCTRVSSSQVKPRCSQSRMAPTPSVSSVTTWCVIPLGTITCGPPSWSWELYTFFPRSLLSAEKPANIAHISTCQVLSLVTKCSLAPIIGHKVSYLMQSRTNVKNVLE